MTQLTAENIHIALKIFLEAALKNNPKKNYQLEELLSSAIKDPHIQEKFQNLTLSPAMLRDQDMAAKLGLLLIALIITKKAKQKDNSFDFDFQPLLENIFNKNEHKDINMLERQIGELLKKFNELTNKPSDPKMIMKMTTNIIHKLMPSIVDPEGNFIPLPDQGATGNPLIDLACVINLLASDLEEPLEKIWEAIEESVGNEARPKPRNEIT